MVTTINKNNECARNRGSYSRDEEKAHKLVSGFAESLGLDVNMDEAGNSYFLIPDIDYDSDILLTGSHLDSQPNAGNYDGAAEVITGIIAIVSQRDCLGNGVKPVAAAFRERNPVVGLMDIIEDILGVGLQLGLWRRLSWTPPSV